MLVRFYYDITNSAGPITPLHCESLSGGGDYRGVMVAIVELPDGAWQGGDEATFPHQADPDFKATVYGADALLRAARAGKYGLRVIEDRERPAVTWVAAATPPPGPGRYLVWVEGRYSAGEPGPDWSHDGPAVDRWKPGTGWCDYYGHVAGRAPQGWVTHWMPLPPPPAG